MTSDNLQLNRKQTADIAIVGGGVIGLSIARELALRGVHDVVVVDKGELGKEASWAAGGILGPQVEADRADEFFGLACASRDLYPDFAQVLHAETGIDVELDTTGTLYIAFTEDEEIELLQRFEWQQNSGLHVEWLDAADVRLVEPNVSDEARCALRFPNDWQVENRKLVEALIVANQKLGVQLLPNCEVTSLRIDRDRVSGAETGNGNISASTVVLCAGAWTSGVTTTALNFTPILIEPIRGQMLCFSPEEMMAQHVIYSQTGYLVPRRDGRVLAGSTSEHVGFDKRVTDEGMSGIKSMAIKIAPSLAFAPILDSWAGFRPRASDDLPVLGPDPDVEGLFYATGHYRNGILLAPITAKLTADSIVGRLTPQALEVFSPKRFRLAAVGI